MRLALARLALIWLAAAFVPAAAQPGIDYHAADAWLARPGLDSPASLVPAGSGYHDRQASARADVFYIHPTTAMRTDVDNAPIDDPQALAMSRSMLMAQATPFNGIARIYAPRYRQITLQVYDRDAAALQAPMNLAYEDVRRAFLHYMAHDNHGQPFFLAAHSQGSNHALRLLSEEIVGTPREAALVAAYLPGMPTPRAVFTAPAATLTLCRSPEQTGCVAVWGVFADGYRDFDGWEKINVYWDAATRRWRSAQGLPLAHVNPVSWRADETPTAPDMHQGAVPFGVPGTHFSQPVSQLLGTRTEHGYTLVWPTPLPDGLFDDGGIFDEGNYHVFDISLFWSDIRANARQRLVAFLSRHAAPNAPLITGPAMATAIAGRPVHLPLALCHGPALLHAEGLPAGLHLDAAAGMIIGTPSVPGQYLITATASQGRAADAAELAFTVTTGTD